MNQNSLTPKRESKTLNIIVLGLTIMGLAWFVYYLFAQYHDMANPWQQAAALTLVMPLALKTIWPLLRQGAWKDRHLYMNLLLIALWIWSIREACV